MMLLSCVNCCHNPLQTDSLGTSVGYCTEHRKVLLAPSQLTCGRLFRKDLVGARANEERDAHERRFSPGMVARLTKNNTPANGGYTSNSKADVRQLARDTVGMTVLDYGNLPSKFASIAELRHLSGARPEVAMLSLGRAYVGRCVDRGGAWTSGLRLFWWTRERLLDLPRVELSDLRGEGAIPLDRRVALSQWSVIMMRAIFISDVGFYASSADRPMNKLASFAEQAAEGAPDLSPKRLVSWLKRNGMGLLDKALPERRYEQISATIRAEEPSD